MNILSFFSYDIMTIILSYSDNSSVVELAPESVKKIYYNNHKKQLCTREITYILSTINCLSSASNPKAFCNETALKIKNFCSDSYISLLLPELTDNAVLDADLFVFPLINKLENILNKNICHIFKVMIIVVLHSGVHFSQTINLTDLDLSKQIKIVRLWLDDPQNKQVLNACKRCDLIPGSNEYALYILPKEIALLKNLRVLHLITTSKHCLRNFIRLSNYAFFILIKIN